jgi:serine-type D-Ala-D-Ala carboxypeptidase (penicillin-binding protein 5/6)
VRRAFLVVALVWVSVSSILFRSALVSGGTGLSGPPPTPVPPYGSPSPYPTALRTPDIPELEPVLSAPSGALVDLESGRVLYRKGSTIRRPIASTTKIMTALLVLNSARMQDVVTVSPLAAAQGGASLDLASGERIKVRDLMYALMLQSSNDAAVALAEHVAGSVEAFVDRMNQRAKAMGLRGTRFRSPNGLDDRGYSTAVDLSRITVRAFRNPAFARIARTKFYTVPSPDGGKRRLQNRNALLWLYPGAFGVKSGFTSAAGSCLVAAAERDGLRLASVVLGAPAEAFSDAATLLDWGFTTFEPRRVVIEGERFDPVEVGGREVSIEAAGTVRVMVRRGTEVRRRVELEPGLALPIGEGERLGEVVVTSRAGKELGRTPVVSPEAVSSALADLPWAHRMWEQATGFLAAMFRVLLS